MNSECKCINTSKWIRVSAISSDVFPHTHPWMTVSIKIGLNYANLFQLSSFFFWLFCEPYILGGDCDSHSKLLRCRVHALWNLCTSPRRKSRLRKRNLRLRQPFLSKHQESTEIAFWLSPPSEPALVVWKARQPSCFHSPTYNLRLLVKLILGRDALRWNQLHLFQFNVHCKQGRPWKSRGGWHLKEQSPVFLHFGDFTLHHLSRWQADAPEPQGDGMSGKDALPGHLVHWVGASRWIEKWQELMDLFSNPDLIQLLQKEVWQVYESHIL